MDQLQNTKDDLRNLLLYVRAIYEVWKRPHYITLEVLIQNIIARIKEPDLGRDEIHKCLQAVEAWYNFNPKDHVGETVYKELDMIIQGYYMSNNL